MHVVLGGHPKPRKRGDQREIDRISARFPPGALVTIEWVGELPYIDDDYGCELDAPEPAVVVRMLPDLSFYSHFGPWVVPFECLHMGQLRVSTTFATQPAGEE